jgi:hypothetical protein
MARYLARDGAGLPTLLSPPTALVVTTFEGEEEPLRQEGRRQGWFVRTCPGPSRTACPVLRGESCEVRASADVAIVFADPKGSKTLGMWPRVRCAADKASPGVIALERRFDPPSFLNTTAVVGALVGAKAILRTAHALLRRRLDRDS